MGYLQRARTRGVHTLAIGVATSAISIWLLTRAIDERAFFEALRGTDATLVLLAVACLFLSLAAKVSRWRALLPGEAQLSYRRLFGILHAGMFLNNVLPLRVGDFTRGALTARQPGVRVGHVVSSMIAERAADATMLLLCFVLAAVMLGDSGLHAQLHFATWVLAGAAIFGVLLFAAVRLGVRRPMWTGRPVPPSLVAFADSWRRIVSPDGWPIWAWSAVAWAFAFALHFLLLRALGIEVDPLLAVIVTCTTNLAMLVPATPGHVGVYHAAATVTLVAAGASSGDAAAFGVLAHLVNVLPVSIVGAAFLASGSLGSVEEPSGEPATSVPMPARPPHPALTSAPVRTSETARRP